MDPHVLAMPRIPRVSACVIVTFLPRDKKHPFWNPVSAIIHFSVETTCFFKYLYGTTSQQVKMSMYLRSKWNDSRLEFPEDEGKITVATGSSLLQEIWKPDVFSRNEITRSPQRWESLTINPNGGMFFVQK